MCHLFVAALMMSTLPASVAAPDFGALERLNARGYSISDADMDVAIRKAFQMEDQDLLGRALGPRVIRQEEGQQCGNRDAPDHDDSVKPEEPTVKGPCSLQGRPGGFPDLRPHRSQRGRQAHRLR